MTLFDLMSKIQDILGEVFGQDKGQAPSGIILTSNMSKNIEKWSRMYRDEPTNNENGRHIRSMRLAAAIPSEIARMTVLEFDSEITGSARADYLNRHYQDFLRNIRTFVEFACAKGGIIFKPYVSEKEVYFNAVQADAFFPIAFDGSGRITGAVFTERLVIDNAFYTRVEIHNLNKDSYRIVNQAYRSSDKNSVGTQIPLADVSQWADIASEATFAANFPLFAYFKPAGANHIDPESPLGVSVFSKAVSLIEDADDLYTQLLWEFESGRRKIFASSDLLKTDGKGGYLLPSGCDSDVFVSLDGGTRDKELLASVSPEFRDASIKSGLNEILRKIELVCGLAYGVISDVQETDKTATEVKISRQRTYSTICDTQKSLQIALEDYIRAVDFYADFYKLAPKGNYNISFDFDDSVIVDAESEQKIWLQEVAAGLMSQVEYRMKRYGEIEDQAREWLAKVDPFANEKTEE